MAMMRVVAIALLSFVLVHVALSKEDEYPCSAGWNQLNVPLGKGEKGDTKLTQIANLLPVFYTQTDGVSWLLRFSTFGALGFQVNSEIEELKLFPFRGYLARFEKAGGIAEYTAKVEEFSIEEEILSLYDGYFMVAASLTNNRISFLAQQKVTGLVDLVSFVAAYRNGKFGLNFLGRQEFVRSSKMISSLSFVARGDTNFCTVIQDKEAAKISDIFYLNCADVKNGRTDRFELHKQTRIVPLFDGKSIYEAKFLLNLQAFTIRGNNYIGAYLAVLDLKSRQSEEISAAQILGGQQILQVRLDSNQHEVTAFPMSDSRLKVTAMESITEDDVLLGVYHEETKGELHHLSLKGCKSKLIGDKQGRIDNIIAIDDHAEVSIRGYSVMEQEPYPSGVSKVEYPTPFLSRNQCSYAEEILSYVRGDPDFHGQPKFQQCHRAGPSQTVSITVAQMAYNHHNHKHDEQMSPDVPADFIGPLRSGYPTGRYCLYVDCDCNIWGEIDTSILDSDLDGIGDPCDCNPYDPTDVIPNLLGCQRTVAVDNLSIDYWQERIRLANGNLTLDFPVIEEAESVDRPHIDFEFEI